MFLHDWIIPYKVFPYLLTDKAKQFTCEFFDTLCTHLGTKQLTKTAIYTQKEKLMKRYDKKIASQLRHYVADHQRNWEIIVQPLIYAYNKQVCWSANTALSFLVLSRIQPRPATSDNAPAFSPDTYYTTKPKALRAQLLWPVNDLRAQADAGLTSTQRWKNKTMKTTSEQPPHSHRDSLFTSKNRRWAPLQQKILIKWLQWQSKSLFQGRKDPSWF